MSWWKFLKSKSFFLSAQIVITLFFCFLLGLFQVDRDAQVLIILTVAVITLIALLLDYIPRKRYYNNIYSILKELDKRTLLAEMIERPDFVDGVVLYDVLKEITRAMNERIFFYQLKQEEYRRYVDVWIHEIKTPIASIEMFCRNNPNEISRKIRAELHKIEDYVEQALYYARSTNLEKDYVIREYSLEKLVKAAIKHHASQLITLHCTPVLENLEQIVFTDAKWVEFILGQLIANSIKYHQSQMQLHFSAKQTDGNVILSVSDNGIGIPAQDLPRIFDMGFTGENGRIYGKSTGIGLYLCKIMCEKMHLKLTVDSEIGQGTTFQIVFPKNKLTLLE